MTAALMVTAPPQPENMGVRQSVRPDNRGTSTPTPRQAIMTELPNVVGFNIGEAETFLRELGFAPSHQLTPSGTVEADVVIHQTPRAGTLLDPRAPVKLLVSGGPPDPPVDPTPREVIPPETFEGPPWLEPVSKDD